MDNWLALLFAILLLIRGLVMLCFPATTDFFMKSFISSYDTEKYVYDKAKFRVLIMVISFVASIILCVYYFTDALWMIIVGLVIIIPLSVYSPLAIRKPKTELNQ